MWKLIDQQKTKIVGSNDLLDAVEPLAAELLGQPAGAATASTQGKSMLGGLLGKITPGSTAAPAPAPAPAPIPQPVPQQISAGGDIFLTFAGASSKSNPGVHIYVNGTLIGQGTLNQGFSASFTGTQADEYHVKVEWESVIPTREYKINTSFKKHKGWFRL